MPPVGTRAVNGSAYLGDSSHTRVSSGLSPGGCSLFSTYTMATPGDTSFRELAASLRASKVPPFYVMEVMKAAAAREQQGETVIHMEVGQPSTGAPAGALEAAQRCLASSAAGTDTLGYTLASGVGAVRSRIARHYQDRYGWSHSLLFNPLSAFGLETIAFMFIYNIRGSWHA